MRLGWAIVIGVLGGAALAWWLSPTGSRWIPTAGPPSTRTDVAAPSGPAPALYRWRDSRGVLHVAQQPPGDGQAYERVEIPPERNIVPMGVATPED